MRENITMHFVQAKGILSQNNGMNIYRGCSHQPQQMLRFYTRL